jgi:HAMP domain-containing protein|tara:strand:- start:8092 stop:8559 length:468 start_codon:yes stop_codon:yes gene_type:complete
MSILAGSSASSMFMLSAAVGAVGTLSSIQAQKRALARENYRLDTEAKLAEVQALENENARTADGWKELANNLAFQSTAGYLDDSRSFLNINKQVEKNMNKDIANIRLMAKSVQHKFYDTRLENRLKSKDLTFGGYTSVAAQLTSGYAKYKYYDIG